jgi:hypothetical protein
MDGCTGVLLLMQPILHITPPFISKVFTHIRAWRQAAQKQTAGCQDAVYPGKCEKFEESVHLKIYIICDCHSLKISGFVKAHQSRMGQVDHDRTLGNDLRAASK